MYFAIILNSARNYVLFVMLHICSNLEKDVDCRPSKRDSRGLKLFTYTRFNSSISKNKPLATAISYITV